MKYIMSLGSDCSVAIYLRDKKLRKVAYPFDWTVIPMRSVIELLDNDFDEFLKDNNLVFLEPVHRKAVSDESVEGELVGDIITPCYCKRYNMLLPHDFSVSGEDDLIGVQQKYTSRIERLISQLNNSNSEFAFIANDAPTATQSWRAQQFKAVSGKTFTNDFVGWKDRLSTILRVKYPNLKYNLYNLDEFKKL